jgi:hypothetical protein
VLDDEVRRDALDAVHEPHVFCAATRDCASGSSREKPCWGNCRLPGLRGAAHNGVACGYFVLFSRSAAGRLLPVPLGRSPSAEASIANRSGASMDLAMAMGLSLFGIFAGSTVFFFYRLPR